MESQNSIASSYASGDHDLFTEASTSKDQPQKKGGRKRRATNEESRSNKVEKAFFEPVEENAHEVTPAPDDVIMYDPISNWPTMEEAKSDCAVMDPVAIIVHDGTKQLSARFSKIRREWNLVPLDSLAATPKELLYGAPRLSPEFRTTVHKLAFTDGKTEFEKCRIFCRLSFGTSAMDKERVRSLLNKRYQDHRKKKLNEQGKIDSYNAMVTEYTGDYWPWFPIEVNSPRVFNERAYYDATELHKLVYSSAAKQVLGSQEPTAEIGEVNMDALLLGKVTARPAGGAEKNKGKEGKSGTATSPASSDPTATAPTPNTSASAVAAGGSGAGGGQDPNRTPTRVPAPKVGDNEPEEEEEEDSDTASFYSSVSAARKYVGTKKKKMTAAQRKMLEDSRNADANLSRAKTARSSYINDPHNQAMSTEEIAETLETTVSGSPGTPAAAPAAAPAAGAAGVTVTVTITPSTPAAPAMTMTSSTIAAPTGPPATPPRSLSAPGAIRSPRSSKASVSPGGGSKASVSPGGGSKAGATPAGGSGAGGSPRSGSSKAGGSKSATQANPATSTDQIYAALAAGGSPNTPKKNPPTRQRKKATPRKQGKRTPKKYTPGASAEAAAKRRYTAGSEAPAEEEAPEEEQPLSEGEAAEVAALSEAYNILEQGGVAGNSMAVIARSQANLQKRQHRRLMKSNREMETNLKTYDKRFDQLEKMLRELVVQKHAENSAGEKKSQLKMPFTNIFQLLTCLRDATLRKKMRDVCAQFADNEDDIFYANVVYVMFGTNNIGSRLFLDHPKGWDEYSPEPVYFCGLPFYELPRDYEDFVLEVYKIIHGVQDAIGTTEYEEFLKKWAAVRNKLSKHLANK